jgi:SAM-dependent methyltransferase
LARSRGIQTTVGRGEALPFGNGKFEAVLVVAASGFADDAVSLFREVARVLSLTGHLVLGDIPADSPWGRNLSNKKAAGNPFYRHARFFTIKELQEIVKVAGFQVEKAASTLLAPPTQTPLPEPPTRGIATNAGFVALSCTVIPARRA